MGSALYVDDITKPSNTLHLVIGKSEQPHAHIIKLDLTKVKQSEGVLDILTFADLTAQTDIGPVFEGDPVMVDKVTEYLGQTLFVVAVTSHRLAKQAALKAVIEYETLPAISTIKEALEQWQFVRPSYSMQHDNITEVLATAPIQLNGHIHILGQEHFYLKWQVAYVLPCDDGGLDVYTSAQHPTEVQQLVAEVTDLLFHSVNTIVRRMGGAFGGKET